jgi:hypothetical protein
VQQPEIEIDATKNFQSVLGFGAAFTDASCYRFAGQSWVLLVPHDSATTLVS